MMKKIMMMFVALFFGMYSYGQLGLGIKGAVTMSSLSTDVADYTNAAKVGFQGGAFVRIGDKWHLQPEAYFSTKAGKVDFNYDLGTSDPASIEQTITLNTIDVPVLVGYKLIDPPTMNLRLQAGPVASFVMNKKFDFSSNNDQVKQEDAGFTDNDFKDMNWGLQFGAGVDFLFLTVDVRYELGLNNMYNKPDGVDIDPNFKNNIFFVSVGWKIL